MGTVPTGCLGCNQKAIEAFLRSHGFEPADFEEIPNPAQAQGKIAICKQCGKAWLIPERREPLES